MPFREFVGVGVLAGAMLFRMFGVFVALPVAALFAASLSGGEAAIAAGVAVGGYGITQAFLQMPAGMLADIFGRKSVMICMLLVFAAGGFVAADAETVWQLACGRLLQGGGAVAAVAAAWISDITAPHRRARAMMVYGSAIALAFVVSLFAAPPLAGMFGMSSVFALSGWLGLMSAAAVSFLPSPPKAARVVGGGGAAIDRRIAMYAASAFVAHYALSAVFLQIPMLLQNEIPLGEHWRAYLPSFLLSLLVAVPMVFAEKRRAIPAAAFLLLAAGAILMLSGGGGLWRIGAGLSLFFAGFVALEAILPARASRAAAAQKRGAAMGAVMGMEFLGMFCGAALSGAMLDFVGAGAALILLILLLLTGCGIMAAVREA